MKHVAINSNTNYIVYVPNIWYIVIIYLESYIALILPYTQKELNTFIITNTNSQNMYNLGNNPWSTPTQDSKYYSVTMATMNNLANWKEIVK